MKRNIRVCAALLFAFALLPAGPSFAAANYYIHQKPAPPVQTAPVNPSPYSAAPPQALPGAPATEPCTKENENAIVDFQDKIEKTIVSGNPNLNFLQDPKIMSQIIALYSRCTGFIKKMSDEKARKGK